MIRELDPYIIEALDEAGAPWRGFHAAIHDKNWRVLMANAASAFLEIKEDPQNKGHWIENHSKTVDGRAQMEPYCMAFVQTIIAYCEFKMDLTSPLVATESVMSLWNNTPDSMKSQRPRMGYIAMWNHRGTTRGHAGIVHEITKDGFNCIEGTPRPQTSNLQMARMRAKAFTLKAQF